MHPDFEASRIRERLDEAEQLNRTEIRAAEAVTMSAEPDRTAEAEELLAQIRAAGSARQRARGRADGSPRSHLCFWGAPRQSSRPSGSLAEAMIGRDDLYRPACSDHVEMHVQTLASPEVNEGVQCTCPACGFCVGGPEPTVVEAAVLLLCNELQITVAYMQTEEG